MRITSKGQVTIPKHIRQRAGLLPNTEVEWGFDGQTVTLRPRRGPRGDLDKARRLVARMRGIADAGLATDEIMNLTRGEGDERPPTPGVHEPPARFRRR